MKNLLFIRHGESVLNQEKRVQGQSDSQLTKRGIEQASLLSKYLQLREIDIIYSSPLKRAIETAEIISKRLSAKIVSEKKIMEINMGEWEGIQFQSLMSQNPELFKMFINKPANVEIPGGEQINYFRARIVEWLDKIVKIRENTVAVVTHAGVINTILCYVLGQDMNSLWRFKTENSSVSEIFFNGSDVRILRINDVSHLTEHLKTWEPDTMISKGERNA